MTAVAFATVVPWLLMALGTWFGYQLVRQNGRILLRLDSIEQRLGPRAAGQPPPEKRGLSIGAPAPDFELPSLTGARRRLSQFRGHDVLLIFFNPQCGFCSRMAADLAALPIDGGQKRAVPIVVSTGDAEENRKLVEQFGIRCLVLLQAEMEVASQYGAQGTPMGYRIDSEGRIASELTIGAEPLMNLAEQSPLPHHDSVGSGGNQAGQHAADPSLARSRLNRSGLKAGAPAPDFCLPRIAGGDLSLADFRGTRVLLVFSSPDCDPCDELAPRLQDIHAERTDLRVLVVSRRDVAANLAKASQLGLTYPIVLQKQWEVSLKYAMFATPIGYLIDEDGILASDVAVGVGPILALADEPGANVANDMDSLPASKERAGVI